MSAVLRRSLAFLALATACGPSAPSPSDVTRAEYEAICRDELHVGMTRDEVRAVLGEPAEENATRMNWVIGEALLLDVFFDEQGKLQRTLISSM